MEQSALYTAIVKDDVDAVKKALGGESSRDYIECTCLHQAVFRGNIAIIRCILENSIININEQDTFGNTALLIALKRAQDQEKRQVACAVVAILVGNGAWVNMRNRKGRTVMYYLFKIVEDEKRVNRDLMIIIDSLQRALDKAKEIIIWKDIFDYLYSLNAGLRPCFSDLLEAAFALKNEELIRYLCLDEGISEFIEGYYRGSVLHKVTEDGYADIAQLLINRNANLLREYDSKGWYPIHTAAYYGRREINEYMLTHDFLLLQYPTRLERDLALHLAVRRGNQNMVALLVGRDVYCATLLLKNNNHRLALHEASVGGSLGIAQIIFSRANAYNSYAGSCFGEFKIKEMVDAVDIMGDSSLHLACKIGSSPELVRLLLQQGAIKNLRNRSGKCAKELIDAGSVYCIEIRQLLA
jgi:ankyrin repeat protein